MTTRRISITQEPATVAEIKALIPLSGSDHDARIGTLISAMRATAEQITGRSLAAGTWQVRLDAFPTGEIRLLWPPIVSVDSIEYVDPAGATVVMPPNEYVLDAHSEPGWVLPAAGEAWPDTLNTANALTVNYTAGLGAGSDPAVKVWIAARVRADIDGIADDKQLTLLDGLLDHLKVYA